MEEEMVTSPPGIRPSKWFRSSDSAQQHPVHGTYEILSNGQPEVRLHGFWDPQRHPEFECSSNEFKLLHGDVFGTATTAVGNAYRSGSFSMNELMDYRIHPKYTLEGLWLSEDELTFTNVRVQLWDQDSWTGWNGHTVNRDPNGRISSVMVQPNRTLTTEHKGVHYSSRLFFLIPNDTRCQHFDSEPKSFRVGLR